MKKILVINGASKFAHSDGELNKTIAGWSVDFFGKDKKYEVKLTNISEGYDVEEEVSKFVWADLIIYHTPIWWFQIPWNFKQYFDEVLTAGHQKGIYFSDGRRSANPTRNYGRGGLMQGTQYMLVTTWNAPIEAFTIEEEFFHLKSVDDGVMYGFHKMNEFIGMSRIDGVHFYDVMKNPNVEQSKEMYHKHLEKVDKEL